MVRLIGLLFLILIAEIPIIIIDLYIGNGFLIDYIKNQSLQIMGLLLGLNIASSIFLVGYFTNIESQKNKLIFSETKKEIRKNIYLMMVLFLIQFVILIGIPKVDSNSSILIKNTAYFLKYASVYLSLLYLYALYEMTNSIFMTDKFIELIYKRRKK